jgi:hypothetical protein
MNYSAKIGAARADSTCGKTEQRRRLSLPDIGNLHLMNHAASAPAALLRAANDNRASTESDSVLAWPTLERIAHLKDAEKVAALRLWRDLCSSRSTTSVSPEVSGNLRREIRPTEGELLTAAGWVITGRERWHHTGRKVNVYSRPGSTPLVVSTGKIGSLEFREGKLIAWGVTNRGKKLKPCEQLRSPQASTSTRRSLSSVRTYLRLPAATASPLAATSLQRPMSGEPAIGDFYDPLPTATPCEKDRAGRYGVERARDLLKAFGVDGAVPFSEARQNAHLPHAARGPDFIVAGPQWVAGRPAVKGTGGGQTSAPAQPLGDVEANIERLSQLYRLRCLLGDTAGVLDLAITDATAEDIGFVVGYAPSSAKKYGARLIDEALTKLIAANDNLEKMKKVAA